MAENIFDRNCALIDKRIEAGLETLRKSYEVKERPVPELFAKLNIHNMAFEIRQYEIVGVGNLVTMKCKSEGTQMDTFTLMPYYKNLPLFTTDYIYSGENRMFLNEIYDLSVYHDDLYDRYIDVFKANDQKHAALPDMPTKPCWYDDIRPVCTSKRTGTESEEENLSVFYENLDAFIKMEKETELLSGSDKAKKWAINKDYADRLVDEGGVSTDVFKSSLGAENTHKFFDDVFFGTTKFPVK